MLCVFLPLHTRGSCNTKYIHCFWNRYHLIILIKVFWIGFCVTSCILPWYSWKTALGQRVFFNMSLQVHESRELRFVVKTEFVTNCAWRVSFGIVLVVMNEFHIWSIGVILRIGFLIFSCSEYHNIKRTCGNYISIWKTWPINEC